LYDSEKTKPFDKVFSSEFAKNCLKGMTEAAERETDTHRDKDIDTDEDSSCFERRGGVSVLLQVSSLK
jgi:hypothetical protein